MPRDPVGSPSSYFPGDGGPPARPAWVRVLIGGLLALCTVILIGLGVWQLERLHDKLALIDRVDRRVHAEPVDMPGPARWPGITAATDEYTRVRVAGRFLNERETLTQAVTDHGAGYWVMTPLQTTAGLTVLANRGFVPAEKRNPAFRQDGQPDGNVIVTGLLRITEPNGGFLRSNDPAADRWYSRDVAAIAAARKLSSVAPYFIDADATPNPGGFPIGGLTVINFANNHLVYALTWFGLAIGVIAAMIYLLRISRRDQPAL